jgi:hypothetical protein
VLSYEVVDIRDVRAQELPQEFVRDREVAALSL